MTLLLAFRTLSTRRKIKWCGITLTRNKSYTLWVILWTVKFRSFVFLSIVVFFASTTLPQLVFVVFRFVDRQHVVLVQRWTSTGIDRHRNLRRRSVRVANRRNVYKTNNCFRVPLCNFIVLEQFWRRGAIFCLPNVLVQSILD